MLQFNSISLVANLSKSSGCEGNCPETPKLSGVATNGRPIRCNQMRLAQTRAVSVFCVPVIHWASSSRPDWFGLISGAVEPANMLGTPRLTSRRGSSSSPRAKNRLWIGTRRSNTPMALRSEVNKRPCPSYRSRTVWTFSAFCWLFRICAGLTRSRPSTNNRSVNRSTLASLRSLERSKNVRIANGKSAPWETSAASGKGTSAEGIRLPGPAKVPNNVSVLSNIPLTA